MRASSNAGFGLGAQKDALQTTELLKELPDGVCHELVLALLD